MSVTPFARLRSSSSRATVGLLVLLLGAPAQASLDFLDGVVGLSSAERVQLEQQVRRELAGVLPLSLNPAQTQAAAGVVSAGIFEHQSEGTSDEVGPEALARIAGVAALACRALALGLPEDRVEEIAQAALGADLDDDLFQAAVRVLDRLDRAGIPPDVARSWLGYVLAEEWPASLLTAAGDGLVRAMQLGLDPEQMALALSVTAAQAPAGQTPAQTVDESLQFLRQTADPAEQQRREAIYRALRAATAAGAPWKVAYGLYEHALLEGWSAPVAKGVMEGVQKGVAAGLPGEQLALALVVRVEQDGDRVAVAQMVREEVEFVRQSMNIPERKPAPAPPPRVPVAAAKTVRWKDVQRSVKSFLGVPYVWGGETRQGTDCSGFTQTVYSEQGVRVPRVSRDQHQHLRKAGTLVGGSRKQSQLGRGDLVFFNKNGRGRITHVGVYMGDGTFAHASCSKGVVISRFTKAYYQRLFADGGRVCAVAD